MAIEASRGRAAALDALLPGGRLDAAAHKVRSLGGKIHMPPQDIPEVGRFAILHDPQGAVFAMIRLNHP